MLTTFFTDLHNVLRWLVLVAGIIGIVAAAAAVGKRAWTPRLASVSRVFTITMDVQFLVGLVLYVFLSPLTTGAFRNFSAAMQSDEIRFFLVEHGPLMLIALILVHIGAVRGKKKESPRQALIFWIIAMLVILAAIPWQYSALLPGMG